MADAPASFDVFAVSPDGYEIHIQLNGQKIYEDGKRLLAQLARDGFKPRAGRSTQYRNDSPTAGPLCAEHNVPYRVFEKGGESWYAHRLEDGTWCRQPVEAKTA